MNETRHTPGPWTITLDPIYSSDGTDCEWTGWDINGRFRSGEIDNICMVTASGEQSGWSMTVEDKANARLIAASPALLSALTALVESVEDDHYKCDIDSDEDCWLDEADKHAVMRGAKQAIAKATTIGGSKTFYEDGSA